MNITEVRVKLMSNRQDKLQAFCSITLDDDFVIRDLKIIEGSSGPFVAMPSRKLADKCVKCSTKNHLRAKYCNECGGRLGADRSSRDAKGRSKLHVDIAHPINPDCREKLQTRILVAYSEEVEKSQQEGYVPLGDDDFEMDECGAKGKSAQEDRTKNKKPNSEKPRTEAKPEKEEKIRHDYAKDMDVDEVVAGFGVKEETPDETYGHDLDDGFGDGGEGKLDAELDGALGSTSYTPPRKEDGEDVFGSGIFS